MAAKSTKARRKKKPAPPKRGRGRPKIDIDWEQVNMMCQFHCTGSEIAAVIGVSEDTMTRRCQAEHKMNFAEYIKRKTLPGNVSIRRKQYILALAGDGQMLRFLGKNWLGQTDKFEQKTEISGTLGPIIIPDNGRDV